MLELALANKDAEAMALLMSQSAPATQRWQDVMDQYLERQKLRNKDDAAAAAASVIARRPPLPLRGARSPWRAAGTGGRSFNFCQRRYNRNTLTDESVAMKALFALMLVSGAALADDAALLRCRQLADGPARLTCYDAIPLPVTVPLAPRPAAGAAPAAAPAAAAAGVVLAAPSRLDMEQMFGREPAVLNAQRLDAIETTIDGDFDGWVPGQRIRLANGQVWKVVDGSDDIMELHNPKVTVKRGLFGAIFLDIEGAHRNPKVTRVK